MISYRFDPDYTIEGRHYSHSLVTWDGVIAGAIAAIAIGFGLSILGVAIGASAFNPYELSGQDDTISIGGALYAMFANLVAFQLGAYIAARSSRNPDHFGGLLTGFMVWALAVFVGVAFAVLATAGADPTAGATNAVTETLRELGDAAEGAPADPGALADAEVAADALAAMSWTAFGVLGLGLAGAIAGGWLGAAHPKWENRARFADRAPYQSNPSI